MGEQPAIRKESKRPNRAPTRPLAEVLEQTAPWKPPLWDDADAGALQALQRGDAPPYLQQRALKFIVEKLCGTYDLHYRPGADGPRDTVFALGRAFPGQQIVKLLNINLAELAKRRDKNV